MDENLRAEIGSIIEARIRARVREELQREFERRGLLKRRRRGFLERIIRKGKRDAE